MCMANHNLYFNNVFDHEYIELYSCKLILEQIYFFMVFNYFYLIFSNVYI